MQDRLSAIAHWIQRQDDELLYTPDGSSTLPELCAATGVPPEYGDMVRQITHDAARAIAARIDDDLLTQYMALACQPQAPSDYERGQRFYEQRLADAEELYRRAVVWLEQYPHCPPST